MRVIAWVTKFNKNNHGWVIANITAFIKNLLDDGNNRGTFNKLKPMPKEQFDTNPISILNQLKNGELLAIESDSNGGLILCKRYHAELVGPGSAIGGLLDRDCTQVIVIGNLSLIGPRSYQDIQQAYEIRQKWIKSLQDLVKLSDPLVRSQKILGLLDNCFKLNQQSNGDRLPDNTIAMLVGVLPKTINWAKDYRQAINPSTTHQKINKKPYYDSFDCNHFQVPMCSSIF